MRLTDKPPLIGILAYRSNDGFKDTGYFRDLLKEGSRQGVRVFLFSHLDVYPSQRKVRGYVPTDSGGWREKMFPWPDLVMDRSRRWDPSFRKMRRRKLFMYINNKFTYKWRAMKIFAETERLQKWIPETMTYYPEAFKQMSRRHRLLYLKPGNGTGGASVVRIAAKQGGKYEVWGRERGRRKLTRQVLANEQEMITWLNHWTESEQIRGGSFMLQQGLDLELVPHRVTDCRVLIQKDGQGEWQVTGIGTRVGGPYSPNTNLIRNKGGKAYQFDSFMRKRFGPQKAMELREECGEMAMAVVQTIEEKFGPMLEFGLDVGIDVNGRVWLIEANPKPSKDLFLKTGERRIYRDSLRKPFQYAIHLLKKASTKASTKEGNDGEQEEDPQP